MSMKTRTRVLPVLAAALLTAGCVGSGGVSSGSAASSDAADSPGTTAPTSDTPSDETPITIDFAHLYDPAHPFHACGAQSLADQVNAAGVNITMNVFPAGQLGGEQQLIQSVESGDIGITMGGPSALANWYGPLGVLDAAYAVDDWDHMVRVWESELGQDFVDGLIAAGNMRPLELWYYGTRHVTANKEVHSPSDLANTKMRAIDTPVSIANMGALGAEPVPVAFSELYLALQQGVIDGQENPLPTLDTAKLYEVQSTLNLTGHLVQSSGVVINEDLFNSMSSKQQEVFLQILASVTEDVTQCTKETEQELLDKWADGSAFKTIVYPEEIDLEAFRTEAANKLPNQFASIWGEGTFEQVRELANN